MTTKEVLAGKVVAKSQLKKSDQKEKICQEITIHRSLKHKHIVGFHDYFEDSHHIYIILEICNKRVSGGRFAKQKAVGKGREQPRTGC